MQKQTIKRFSILGLVLIAASAVTAAVLPSAKPDVKATPSLTHSGQASTLSCELTDNAATQPCADVTASSGSTSDPLNNTGNTNDGGIVDTTG